jgi:hypothetical protein
MKRSTLNQLCLVIAAFALMMAAATASRAADEAKAEKAGEAKTAIHLFGNRSCPVSGEAVNPDASVTYTSKDKKTFGRLYLCCMGCAKKAAKNAEELYTKLYRTDKKTGKPIDAVDLKNAKCPMSGEDVEANATIEYNGMLVHFCCPGCAEEFVKEADAKLASLVPNLDDFKFEPKAGSHSDK